jgi:hypothetical protein
MAMNLNVMEYIQLFKLEDYIEYRRARKLGTKISSTNSYARYLRFKVKGLTNEQIRQKLWAATLRGND